MSTPDPLPLDVVVSGRDLSEPRLSPDGRRVAFAHRWGGSAAISAVPTSGGGPERLLTFGPDPAPGRGSGGGCYAWLPDSDGVVYAARDGELWSVRDTTLRRLTHHARECRAPAIDARGEFVVHVVDEAQVWACSLVDGDAWRLDDGRHAFCFDPAVAPDGCTVSWLGWSPPHMPWDAAVRVDVRRRHGGRIDGGRTGDTRGADDLVITTWGPADGAVQQPRFAPDGTPTCVHDGTGWLVVHHGDHPVRDEPLEHGGPTWGMGQRSYAVDADGTTLVARNEAGFGTLVIVDRTGVRDLAPGFVGMFAQVSAVGGRVAALRSGPTTPPEVVVVDAQGTRVVATSGAEAWDRVVLADPEPIVVRHRDVVLHARLHRASAPSGRLLCWIHGGPTDQWPADFRPRLAYWRTRGWDVVTVDPRGSTGHGRRYQQALNGGWGQLDVDDAATVLADMHHRHGTAPASTVVIGGSSGGLTALGILLDHPELVAGGVASYPVSDLAALADATHRFEAHYTDTLIGPPDLAATAQAMHDRSPVHRADRLRRPLLLFHGDLDPVVPRAHSDLLVDRILASGGDVEYVVYEGEGHGFRDPANVRDEYARTEAFLGRVVN